MTPHTTQPGPGLDIDQLRALRPSHPATTDLPARIRTHLDTHDGYLAFSGGKDSLVTLDLALRAEPNIPVVFFDSGFEFPETYQYLHAIQEHYDIRLDWITARHTTLEILTASGAWDHHAPNTPIPDLHQVLITEPAAKAHHRHGPGEVWGVRARESRGRAALYATALSREIKASCHGCCACRPEQRRTHGGVVRRIDGTTVFGPVWDWSTEQIWGYIAAQRLPMNPVYSKLRRLGAPEHFLRVSHMLDGTRLEEGRLTWLRRGWPDIFADIARALPRIREFV